MRSFALALTALAIVVQGAHAAQPFQFAADSSTYRGTIVLFLSGEPGERVAISETVRGVAMPLRQEVLSQSGINVIPRAATWRCDRTSRSFVAVTPSETATFSVRTPSCRQRFAVAVPRRVKPDSRLRVRVRDGFELGDQRPRLCVRPPGGRDGCRTLRMTGSRATTRSLRVRRRGLWRVTLRTRHQRLVHAVAVGVPAPRVPRALPRILLTGDSMMQSVDNELTDRLRGRARMTTSIHVGRGLSRPGFDFVENTRRQARKLKPAATVLFLGANDGFDLAGSPCCGEPWIQAYAARARRMIRAAGRRAVWLTLPAPRSAKTVPIWAAVNEALARATAAERRSRLVELVPVFTPDFQYSPFINRRGKRLRVRESDGLHLNVSGARITASLVARALEDAGALPRR